MKLNLPEQKPPTRESTPSNPRKLKKVLSALPNANMGELTKQIFQILRDQNRQPMPNKHRLENLEMLRIQARNVFNNLKKYFINRTLPLPEKSQKIVNLNQLILQELVNGYQIITYESANNVDKSIDDSTLSTAIYRAIKYLSEMFLRASEIYAPCPENLWQEAHQLFIYAESKNLADSIIIDTENTPEKTTIENCYKQLLLFALARPIALRQSDSERIYKKLFQWSQYASLHREASEKMIDHVFSIKVHDDAAPNYLSKNDIESGVTLRILDATKLVAHVRNVITEQNKLKPRLTVGDDIPVETLTILANTWAKNTKRRFSRAERLGQINVAIGLKNAAKAIRDSLKKNDTIDTKSGLARTSTSANHEPAFTLEKIVGEHDKREQGYMTHTEIGAGENNSWDMVAKGRVLTETYEKETQHIAEQNLGIKKNNEESHWEIVNISAGGYCLHWISDETSKAQIGEIIVLKEFDATKDFEWRIGVIRWMQFTQTYGLEIGVQVISPKIIAATAQRVNRPEEPPFDCLMLPGTKALKQAASTILPSHAFKTNDKLVVQILANKFSITLEATRKQTGSFTQFTYKSTEEATRIKKQAKKELATKNKDDFDELWSSL
ncbi:MAG: hypothetical protein COB77_03050 [Gammaproteobacteria bacterium]|nr:MAG: hypothetical protein COB77_03050 [Gammaproteobacteria bacterium]